MERKELNENDVMRAAMKERGMTQVVLAERLKMLQGSLSGSLNRRRVTMEVFRRILNAMDYDVAVIDRKSGKVKWTVGKG